MDRLWEQRLAPFALNLPGSGSPPRTGRPGARPPPIRSGRRQAGRLAARLRAAAPQDVLAVDHIGSTAVPGLEAEGRASTCSSACRDLAAADRIAPLLAEAGFPRWPGIISDNPKPAHPDPADWGKRLHGNADPGRPVNLHVRAAGSPGWRYALCFRDWLRDRRRPPGRTTWPRSAGSPACHGGGQVHRRLRGGQGGLVHRVCRPPDGSTGPRAAPGCAAHRPGTASPGRPRYRPKLNQGIAVGARR